jgi:hypothetical protein
VVAPWRRALAEVEAFYAGDAAARADVPLAADVAPDGA